MSLDADLYWCLELLDCRDNLFTLLMIPARCVHVKSSSSSLNVPPSQQLLFPPQLPMILPSPPLLTLPVPFCRPRPPEVGACARPLTGVVVLQVSWEEPLVVAEGDRGALRVEKNEIKER